VDLDATTDELYGLRPDEFVGARDARVKQARTNGDRGLATALTKLRRPTVAASLANLLVRERPAEITALAELGEAMRAAQRQLAGSDLRELSRQRQTTIAALAAEARRLARERGQDVAEASVQELQMTLEAALASADAARELRTGRLINALQFTGFDGIELAADVRAPTNEMLEPRATAKVAAEPPAKDLANAADRRRQEQRAKAEMARQEFAAASAAADKELETQTRRGARLEEDLATLAGQISELERQIALARANETQLRRQHDQAETAHNVATRNARSARQRLEKAEARIGEIDRS
jgi:hypothetical protein